MFTIDMVNNDNPIQFNVVVAVDESELDALVAHHIDYINKPAVVYTTTYADLRRSAYPRIEDQLDILYHGGYDAWYASIKAIKDAIPK